MKVTIIADDGYINIDGEEFSGLNLGLPANVHAVQFDTNSGEVEDRSNAVANRVITEITEFQSALDAHATEKARIAALPLPSTDVTTITKLQFTEWCETNNKLTDLMNLLSGDSVLMFKWNAATSLDINNPLVIGAAATLGLVAQDVFNEIGQ